jgi:hypothetical protein
MFAPETVKGPGVHFAFLSHIEFVACAIELATTTAIADRRHIFFSLESFWRAVGRYDRLSLGRWDRRPLANPAANELAGLIAQFHTDPAIHPELAYELLSLSRGGKKADSTCTDRGNKGSCDINPWHSEISFSRRAIRAAP